jgi:hypothetical protein
LQTTTATVATTATAASVQGRVCVASWCSWRSLAQQLLQLLQLLLNTGCARRKSIHPAVSTRSCCSWCSCCSCCSWCSTPDTLAGACWVARRGRYATCCRVVLCTQQRVAVCRKMCRGAVRRAPRRAPTRVMWHSSAGARASSHLLLHVVWLLRLLRLLHSACCRARELTPVVAYRVAVAVVAAVAQRMLPSAQAHTRDSDPTRIRLGTRARPSSSPRAAVWFSESGWIRAPCPNQATTATAATAACDGSCNRFPSPAGSVPLACPATPSIQT